MSTDISFRPATLEDSPVLHQLTIEGLDSQLDLESYERCLRDILDGGVLAVWVALTEQHIAGTFSIAIIPAHGGRCTPLAVVEDVIVAAELRGRGIGRAMMEKALGIARGADCYKLMLSSNLTREEAHRFYDSLGFERHGYSFAVNLDQPGRRAASS